MVTVVVVKNGLESVSLVEVVSAAVLLVLEVVV